MRNSALLTLLLCISVAAEARPPIIDMHAHALRVSQFGPVPPQMCADPDNFVFYGYDPRQPYDIDESASCPKLISAPATDELLLAETLREFERRNIIAVVSGDSGEMGEVEKWQAASPERVIPAVSFFVDDGPPDPEHVATLRKLVSEGRVKVFAEVAPQYRGMSPADPSLEPFFALAEELDIPVGIHMGYGAPGGPYWQYPKYRAALGKPLLLEDVLLRHPKLRLYIMHAGLPFVDELLALMFTHPQVYVDVAYDNWGYSRAEFWPLLKRIVDAGYGRRVMFGSDQMVWPQAIELAIESIEKATFLTPEQKRDILYNNAARFLRLTPEEIARHHRM